MTDIIRQKKSMPAFTTRIADDTVLDTIARIMRGLIRVIVISIIWSLRITLKRIAVKKLKKLIQTVNVNPYFTGKVIF